MPPPIVGILPGALQFRSGPTAIPPSKKPRRNRNDEPVLIDQFPAFKVFPCGFTKVAGPNSGITNSAWFGLGRWKVGGVGPFDPQQEIGVYAVSMELGPCDSASAADTSWGDTNGLGTGAAIAVGINLPFGTVGGRRDASANIPGVETTGQGALLSQRSPQFIMTSGFAAGKFTDPTPNKVWLRVSFAPYVYRIAKGQTLDVAWVVRGSQVNNQAGNFNGLARVEISAGLTEHEIAWSE